MEWSEERVELLKSLWSKGRTASQIAEELGDITRNAVIGKVHRLGLSSRPSPIRRERQHRPAPVAAPREARPKRVSDRECHWPIGHPREPGFHFCGAPAEPDRPYCAAHCVIAYRRSDNPAA
ncbi:MAG: global cell cycle regulator GcrA-like protein [Rhodospirillales bacterium]|nr:MAG: global cell cycle regulator GcrA-like protein [Rhodospirillales bacterium]